MIAAEHPEQQRRLAALRELEILDTDQEAEYDDIVELASRLCDAPIAVVNLIDADRQWFKAEKGLGVRSTPLDTSICSHVILQDDYVEIADTLLDDRMVDNPLCSGTDGLRFYAGALLRNEDGLPLGTLCVLDRKPRVLDAFQRKTVEALGRQVTRLLDLRLSLKRQELLAQEIDHRVKNSLASVGAIVRMQASRSGDENVRTALNEVGTRLAAITAVHEQLHQAAGQSRIDLSEFLDRLSTHLKPLLPESMRLIVDAESAEMPSERISAAGLIVNEFVANCVKHGDPGMVGITARIVGQQAGKGYVLRCEHDGQADEATLRAIKDSGGLGARIIVAAARTFGGEATWHLGNPGLVLEIR